MKIDYVVPYVDSTKTTWQELFFKYKSNFKEGNKEFNKRFSVNPLFKFSLRGIEKFMPWINQLVLIVQSYDQVPEFIDVSKVRVVLHEEFIPKQFLPTFNANTIEMFMHRIEGLSELFIYGNDDTYVFNHCSQTDFFIDAFPRNNIRFVKTENDSYSRMLMNLNDQIWRKVYGVGFPRTDGYFTNFHVQQSYSKRINSRIFELFKDEIYRNLGPFRNEKQFTQVLFSLYLARITNGKYLNNKIKSRYFNLSQNVNIVARSLPNLTESLICLNNGDAESNEVIFPIFNTIFNVKSKYEK